MIQPTSNGFVNYIAQESVKYSLVLDRQEVTNQGLVVKICEFVKRLFIACADILLSLYNSKYVAYKERLMEEITNTKPIQPNPNQGSPIASENSVFKTVAKVALVGAGVIMLGLLVYQLGFSASSVESLDKQCTDPKFTEALSSLCKKAVESHCKNVSTGSTICQRGYKELEEKICLADYISKDWNPFVTSRKEGGKYLFECPVYIESSNCNAIHLNSKWRPGIFSKFIRDYEKTCTEIPDDFPEKFRELIGKCQIPSGPLDKEGLVQFKSHVFCNDAASA